MSQFQVFKETQLPSRLQPNAIYLIANQTKQDYVELYVTSSTGVARRQFNEADARRILQEFQAAQNSLVVVETILARDTIQSPKQGQEVYVIDAQSDSTVNRGGARYIRHNNQWIKTAETESLDIQLSWANLQNKPTSSVAQIDQAVQNAHSHSNKTILDQISEDSQNNLLFRGKAVKTQWEQTNW